MADDVTQAVIFSLTVTRGKSKGRMRQDVLRDSQTFLIYMAAGTDKVEIRVRHVAPPRLPFLPLRESRFNRSSICKPLDLRVVVGRH